MAGFKVVTSIRTANYGPGPMKDPIGIMLHHTAGRKAGDLGTLTRRGTWVSANDYITKDGTIYELAPWPRRAWHAGSADRGTGYVSDGNTYYWGIELENLGDSRDPYTKAQINALVWRCRQICARRNITSPRALIRHRDFAPSRKIDPSNNFPFAAVRNRVFASDAPTPQPSPAKPESSGIKEEKTDYERINFLSHGPKNAEVGRAAAKALNKVARERGMGENFAASITHNAHIKYVSRLSSQAKKDQLVSVIVGTQARKYVSPKVSVIGTLDKTDILDAMGSSMANTIEKTSWRLASISDMLGFGQQEKSDVIASFDRDTKNLA